MVEQHAWITQSLLRSPWLSRAAPGLAELVAHEGRLIALPAGAWAYGEGDEETGLLFVLEGAVQIYCQAPGEREVLIGHLGAGGALGQSIRLGGGPRLVTAICVVPSQLLSVADSALNRIAAKHPEIWRAIAHFAYVQMSTAIRQLAEAIALPPRQRLASRLAGMATVQGEGGGAVLHLSQQALADMTGVTRKTVNGHLRDFAARGLLTTDYGRIVIRDRAGLERIAVT